MSFIPSPQDRYLSDKAFSSIVDMMESMIQQCQFTPSELRDAALLAAIHYEIYHPPKPVLVPGKCWALTRELRKERNE